MANRLDIGQSCGEKLQNAETDVERIDALLLAAEHIKSEDCDSGSKTILFRSVGADFLSRMLNGQLIIPDSEGCAKEAFIPTALAIITNFCVDPDLAKDEEMIRLAPHILNILEDCDKNETYVGECLQYIRSIIQHPEGRQSLLLNGALHIFGKHYSKIKSDEILDMALILVQTPVINSCDRYTENLDLLISKVATEFEKTNSKRKFKLCSALCILMYSFNKSRPQNGVLSKHPWHKKILIGLQDILTSRIDDEQKTPALKLAAIMLDHFGFQWTHMDSERGKKFQILLVLLSSIEIRMQLEDQPLEQILKNADLVKSCFIILEVAINQFLLYLTDIRVKNQIVESLTDAGTAVLTTMKSIKDEAGSKKSVVEETFLIYAMVRFLSVGFTSEVLNHNSAVLEAMPLIMKVATDSFYSYKSSHEEIETNAFELVESKLPADSLPPLLPALANIVSKDAGRKIVVGSMNALIDSLFFYWSIFQHQLVLKRGAEGDVNSDGKVVVNEKTTYEETNSTIVCLLNLLKETVIIQPDVTQNPRVSTVFAFIKEMLPDLEPNINTLRPLHATAAIFGLILIKNQKEMPEQSSVLSIIRSSLHFLNPYFSKVQSDKDLVFVSKVTPKFSIRAKDLWLLGINTLKTLMESEPWTKSHIEKELDASAMEYLTSDEKLIA